MFVTITAAWFPNTEIASCIFRQFFFTWMRTDLFWTALICHSLFLPFVRRCSVAKTSLRQQSKRRPKLYVSRYVRESLLFLWIEKRGGILSRSVGNRSFLRFFYVNKKMEEEATIREMESKELTERNEQLRRETGELRLVLTLKRIVSWFIHYSNFTSYQLTVFSNWNCELLYKLGVNLLSVGLADSMYTLLRS